jgi:sugar transferase EpsL
VSTFYRRRGKRIFDFFASGVLLTITLPIVGVVTILVRTQMGSPILFRQQRSGYAGQPFTLIKFRTMLNAVDSQGMELPDVERLTGLGRKLRASSIDELPELWSVLRGDMSLVGPRPLLMEYLPRYSKDQARRHDVLPGVTGWAQVNGRNLLSWDEKFGLDVWYVDNLSFGLDLRILWRTIASVIRREGISPHGQLTTDPFQG